MRLSPQSLGFARGDTMIARLRSWWQKIKTHPMMTVIIIVAGVLVTALIIVIVLGYWFNWPWVGVSGGNSKITTTTTATEQPPAKTLWDWLNLLGVLGIPVVVGFGAAWFTAQQGKVSERENKDNQREKALQDYIDKMSELLLDKHLRDSQPKNEVREVARVRTLTVLSRLDGERKRSVLKFLHESDLLKKDKPIIDLNEADLREAHLDEAQLIEANLCKAKLMEANLSKVNLEGANLSRANLSRANLNGANLSRANLNGAKLIGANLYGVDLIGADLGDAKLIGAKIWYSFLEEASLTNTDLSGASLRGLDLEKTVLLGAKVTAEQLKDAKRGLATHGGGSDFDD